jgi:outer membrane protein OmpA-like peptidoglycan-associated protein
MQLRASLVAHYLKDPLVVRPADGSPERALVSHRQQLDLEAAIGLFDRIELGLRLPVTPYQQGRLPGFGLGPVASTGLGNAELYGFVTLLSGDSPPFGIAIGAPVSFPTRTNAAYMGERGISTAPQLRVSTTLGPVRLAVNGLVRLPGSPKLNNLRPAPRLGWRAGALYMPTSSWGVGAEFVGGTLLTSPFQSAHGTRAEVLVGGRYRPIPSIDLRAAIGRGVVRGFGSPDVRSVLGIAYHYGRSSETDLDPACRPPAEGVDPSECPDADFDEDGVVNRSDACPRKPEDRDGFEDEDGCPDPDNDQDGVPDADDACPHRPEDPDGFEDDGCPDLDNDGDGFSDPDDQCSTSPEDFDGFQDEDGCRDDDNDNDGVVDVRDHCPEASGPPEQDGCPQDDPPEAEVTEEKIRISERIFFHTDRAIIRPRSYDVLDKVADALKSHPDVERVEIRGYADERGRNEYNFHLSLERAKVVRLHLVQKAGIDPNRLEVAGYGETEGPSGEDSEADWAESRRVEFKILKRSD